MAQAKQFFHYLSQNIDLSPAGSEEELQASHIIERGMEKTGLATRSEEFDTRNPSSLLTGIFYVLVFVGVFLTGFGGFLGALIGFILLALGILGIYAKDSDKPWTDFLSKPVRSQNVVGFHKGHGPASSSSVRKIVIVAHYDSGHNELLSSPKIARLSKYIFASAPVGILIAGICAILHLFVGLPAPFLACLWLIGFICAIPALVLGVNGIGAHFGALTGAANDNNASIAAMLGVAADVSAHGKTTEMPGEEDQFADEMVEDGQEPASQAHEGVQNVGASVHDRKTGAVRHGKKMLQELAVLPSACEITYATDVPEQTPQSEAVSRVHTEVEAFKAQDELLVDAIKTAPEPVDTPVIPQEPAPSPVTTTGVEGVETSQVIPVVPVADVESAPVAPAPAFVKPEVEPFSAAPEAPFVSASSQNPAQRASLFDLPDPEETTVDPLSSGFDMQGTQHLDVENEVPGAAPTGVLNTKDTFDTISVEEGVAIENPYEVQGKRKKSKQKREHKSLFKGKKQENEESMSEWLGVEEDFDAKQAGRKISSWDNFDDSDDDFWKGGARRTDANLEGSEQGAEDAGELADAVLKMDEVNLIAHDIYFVATGASALNHAGIKHFLAEHKKELRGAYVFSLESIGAGELTVFSKERVHNSRRATRRILKTFDRVARDLHIGLVNAPQLPGESDTSVALARGVRGVTLMGCDPGEVPALAHTNECTPEHVQAEQIENVNRLLDEVIRRL